MRNNVAYVIIERNSGRFYCAVDEIFQSSLGFSCIFPSYGSAHNIIDNEFGDYNFQHYAPAEIEIDRFSGGQLDVRIAEPSSSRPRQTSSMSVSPTWS